jgi:hypothetical protein
VERKTLRVRKGEENGKLPAAQQGRCTAGDLREQGAIPCLGALTHLVDVGAGAGLVE